MITYRNPEIWFGGISVIPPPVVEVETALPAFIGYTAKATSKVAMDLILVPTLINSMREFENFFGLPYDNEITITIHKNSDNEFSVYSFKEVTLKYLLYYSVKIYFENGGGPCYILSVDTYQNPQQVLLKQQSGSSHAGLLNGLFKLSEIEDVSLVVIPEAVKLSAPEYSQLVRAALLQCHTLDNRFAIFDLYDGDAHNPDLSQSIGLFGNQYLNYGSAYYPFVRTTINNYVNAEGSNVKVICNGKEYKLNQLKKLGWSVTKLVKSELRNRFVNLPSSGAVAGAYVTSDKNRGVWKSPANLSLCGIMEPLVAIDKQSYPLHDVDPDHAKSINNVRAFFGKGVLVWGARTLEPNDNEEQYVSVRRFMIMVKESLRSSTSWAIFESNDTNTWIKICLMIENYLTMKWREGALAGISPQQAFYVNCGLGTTMTSLDVEEGRIIVEVGLAILRASEFKLIRFSHNVKFSKSLRKIA
jgi:phage tail sheath protein FI